MSNLIEPAEYTEKTVLVTGGSGFIGSHLVERLVGYDANVVVIEDFSTGPRTYIKDLEEEVNLIESDVANVSRPLPGFSEIENVFHLAGITSVSRSEADPMTTHRANLTGTLRLLEIARRIEPEMVVVVGSLVEGGSTGIHRDRTFSGTPSSLYAASKGAMELYTAAYYERFSVPGIVLRPSRVFGPRQHQDGGYTKRMSSLIKRVLTNEPPELPSEEGDEKDYIFVDDVVDALLLAGTSTDKAGEGFDICSGTALTDRELLGMIEEVCRFEAKEPIFVERDDPYRERAELCPETAREQFGFDAKTSFQKGLEQTVDWFQKQI